MYSSKTLNDRINIMLNVRNKTKKYVLSAVGANENALNQMSDKKGLSSFTLARIADELECSVDYLLGREDENGNKNFVKSNVISNVHNSNITDNNNTGAELADGTEKEMLEKFRGLDFSSKLKVMQLIDDMSKKQ